MSLTLWSCLWASMVLRLRGDYLSFALKLEIGVSSLSTHIQSTLTSGSGLLL